VLPTFKSLEACESNKQLFATAFYKMAPVTAAKLVSAPSAPLATALPVTPGHGSYFEAFAISGMSAGGQFVIWLLVALCFGTLCCIVGRDIRDKIRIGEFQRSMRSLGGALLALINPLTYFQLIKFLARSAFGAVAEGKAARKDRKAAAAGCGHVMVVPRITGDGGGGEKKKGKGKEAEGGSRELEAARPRSREGPLSIYGSPKVLDQCALPPFAKERTIERLPSSTFGS
jgi:hypothetical protein